MKKITLFLIGLLAFSTNSSAQDGMEAILLAGSKDAGKLTKAYTNPAMKGLIYSMNSGWYHTAKVHKKFGFDLTIGANLASIPTKDEVFTFADLGLSNFVDKTPISSPTVAGNMVPEGDKVFIKIPANTLKDRDGNLIPTEVTANFKMPDGVKKTYL